MKVKNIKHNWRQVGSTIDRDGAGEDYDFFEVGINDTILIEEIQSVNGSFNYVVHKSTGEKFRLFNPNFVEYFK